MKRMPNRGKNITGTGKPVVKRGEGLNKKTVRKPGAGKARGREREK